MLIDRGFTLVRPLAGGLEAWVDAGYPSDVILSREDGEGSVARG